jgi:serine/threonine protein kinase
MGIIISKPVAAKEQSIATLFPRISVDDLLNMNDCQTIATGNSSNNTVVYSYAYKDTNQQKRVAVKVLSGLLEAQANIVLREIDNIKDLEHPNLIKFHGYDCEEVKQKIGSKMTMTFYIVTDLGETDLKLFLADPTKRQIFNDYSHVMKFIDDMLGVCAFLEELGKCHRDIKPANILLQKDQWKLADTGGMKKTTGATLQNTLIMSLGYEAPEIVIGGRDTMNWHKCDAYSMGIVFLEVCGCDSFDQQRFLSSDARAECLEKCILEVNERFNSAGLTELLKSMLCLDPDVRKSFKNLNKLSVVNLIESIPDATVNGVAHLTDSLSFLNQKTVSKFFTLALKKMVELKKNAVYQKIKEEQLIAIMLWTCKLLSRKLNKDLFDGTDLTKWYTYLKSLVLGLRQMPYYNGKAFRGFKNCRDVSAYHKGKTFTLKTISILAIDEEYPKKMFSTSTDVVVEIETIFSRDISDILLHEYKKEAFLDSSSRWEVIEKVDVISKPPLIKEALLATNSRLEVIEVVDVIDKPALIKLREIPPPSGTRVIFWMSDNLQHNHQKELENANISCIFCSSTKDAIKIIKSYWWLLYFSQCDFTIITDMVRLEDGKMIDTAGIDLLKEVYNWYEVDFKSFIYCSDVKLAQENCDKAQFKGTYSIGSSTDDLDAFLRPLLGKRKRKISIISEQKITKKVDLLPDFVKITGSGGIIRIREQESEANSKDTQAEINRQIMRSAIKLI